MTDYKVLKRKDELIKNNKLISNFDLVTYQRQMTRDYPYYPLEEKDWNKIHYEAITKKGLEQLEILRIQITMGRASSEDIVIYMRLLELYVCNNPSLKRARRYKKELDFHFNILSKTHYFPDLIKEELTIDNSNYSKEKVKQFTIWGNDLIQRCYQLGREEEISN